MMAIRSTKYLLLLLSICNLPSFATPILGLDLDPTTPGIQSTFTADAGDSVSVSLVAFDDGVRELPLFPPGSPPAFPPILVDTVSVDFFLSGTGGASFVSAAVGGFGTGGTPFAMSSSGSISSPGTTLGAGAALSSAGLPTGGITGGLGYSSFFGALPAPPGTLVIPFTDPFLTDSFDVLIDLVFSADSVGIVDFSILDLLFSAPSVSGGQLLFAGATATGGLLFPTLLTNTLEIVSSTTPPTGVPEPGIALLMVFGLAGLFFRRK